MSFVKESAGQYIQTVIDGWNRFWFTPAKPHTLALIRILAGAMLFYTHLVYAIDLPAFLGRDSWIPVEVSRETYEVMEAQATWSYLWYVRSPGLMWTLHILALGILLLFTCGLFTRIVSVLAWVITISYCHRLNGSWFGLDHVNALLVTYLMLAPCGAVYSVDRLLQRRRAGGQLSQRNDSIATNVATRLIQLHMCVIYLFGGISKMKGDMWWNGSALWGAVSNLEYQSIDMTWLVNYPEFTSLLSHLTLFWELFYCVLIWPKLTRPITLALAVAVHGGIALFLGMITFGLVMIIGNLAFLSPALVKSVVERGGRKHETPAKS